MQAVRLAPQSRKQDRELRNGAVDQVLRSDEHNEITDRTTAAEHKVATECNIRTATLCHSGRPRTPRIGFGPGSIEWFYRRTADASFGDDG